MRAGLTISTLLHLLLLVWLFVTLPSTKIESTEAVSVDVVSDTEFSQIMQGTKNAAKAEVPKPVVDKVGDPAPVKDPTPKVVEKQPEIAPAAEAPPPAPKPPDPTPDKAEAKPDKAEVKPEKTETKPDKAEPTVDEIAEALKRDEQKKKDEAKKLAEQKKKDEAKKREEAKRREQQEKFDTGSIENRLALLDKRAPQRQAATGTLVNPTPTLGAAVATGPTLSVSELDALRHRLAECWDIPVGVRDARNLVVTVHFTLKKDGSLSGEPELLPSASSGLPVFRVASESALRAVHRCAPFSFLPVAKYDIWNDLTIDFDPQQMFGG